MTLQNTGINQTRGPIQALLTAPKGAVLAVIAGIEGPSYRPLGAMMAILPGAGEASTRVGTLSSGCIEADIVLHARAAAGAGQPALLRYGRGSPFADIQLPCGGGLDIVLLPDPDQTVLARLAERHADRVPATLDIDLRTGALALGDTGDTARTEDRLLVRFDPDLRFVIFGKGPEASTFAALVHSAGYPCLLLSPDEETRSIAGAAGCDARGLTVPDFPADLVVDERTAITLFFHDHEWEPAILAKAVETPAFYIGAQGSQRARDARHLAMEALGVSPDQRARLHGPVGLIPSARDAGTLAVSVLAEVLASAMARE